MLARGHAHQARGAAELMAHSGRRRLAVEPGGGFLLSAGGRAGHGLGCADEVLGGLEVEEVEVLQLVVLW